MRLAVFAHLRLARPADEMHLRTVGPVGTRFHHRCLKCACGKKLDSGAKSIELPSEAGEHRRRFACRDCIDKDRLAKRSLSSATAFGAARGRI